MLLYVFVLWPETSLIFSYLRAKVYTIRAHGPLGLRSNRSLLSLVSWSWDKVQEWRLRGVAHVHACVLSGSSRPPRHPETRHPELFIIAPKPNHTHTHPRVQKHSELLAYAVHRFYESLARTFVRPACHGKKTSNTSR